jgi:hypothetical protein
MMLDKIDGTTRIVPPPPPPPPPAAPVAPLPPSHDLTRPLVVCAWDAPNMDACLHSVTGHRTVSRPRLDAFAQWLTGVTPPGDGVGTHDVEAQLFIAVPAARANAMAPFISAVRQSGMGVFCRDRDEGDIDDALLRFVEQRVGERHVPGTLVIATSDQALGRETAQRAADAGWRIVIVGYRELCAWPAQAGYEFVDAEEIPDLFEAPLDRFRLDDLPQGGTYVSPVKTLTAAADGGLPDELLEIIRRGTEANDGVVSLTALGQQARAELVDFRTRASSWSTLTELVEHTIDGQPYALKGRGTPEVSVVAS